MGILVKRLRHPTKRGTKLCDNEERIYFTSLCAELPAGETQSVLSRFIRTGCLSPVFLLESPQISPHRLDPERNNWDSLDFVALLTRGRRR